MFVYISETVANLVCKNSLSIQNKATTKGRFYRFHTFKNFRKINLDVDNACLIKRQLRICFLVQNAVIQKYLPSQLVHVPLYPELQIHVNDPSVLLQAA